MMEWINIKNKLPAEYTWALVLALKTGPYESCSISFAMLRDDDWYFLDEGFENAVTHGNKKADMLASDITHWMPLPDLPKSTRVILTQEAQEMGLFE